MHTEREWDVCRKQYSEEVFRHVAGITQSLSYWIFTWASRTFSSLSWPLLLCSISVAFLNIVTSKERKKKKNTRRVLIALIPPSVFTQVPPASDISFPTQPAGFLLYHSKYGLGVRIYTSDPFSVQGKLLRTSSLADLPALDLSQSVFSCCSRPRREGQGGKLEVPLQVKPHSAGAEMAAN